MQKVGEHKAAPRKWEGAYADAVCTTQPHPLRMPRLLARTGRCARKGRWCEPLRVANRGEAHACAPFCAKRGGEQGKWG